MREKKNTRIFSPGLAPGADTLLLKNIVYQDICNYSKDRYARQSVLMPLLNTAFDDDLYIYVYHEKTPSIADCVTWDIHTRITILLFTDT